VRHLGMLRKVTSKWVGELELMGQPSLSPHALRHRPRRPRRGEHTEEILAEAGYSPEDLARMKSSGVFVMMTMPHRLRFPHRAREAWLDGAALHIRFNNPRSTTRSGGHVGSASAAARAGRGRRRRAAGRLLRRGHEVLRLRRRHLAVARTCARRARPSCANELVADGRAHGHPTTSASPRSRHPRLLHRRAGERLHQLRHPPRDGGLGVRDSGHAAGAGATGCRPSSNLVGPAGPGRAKDMFFTARRLGRRGGARHRARERVVPPEGLDALVAEYVLMIATGAPLSFKAGKRNHPRGPQARRGHRTPSLCRRLILDCFECEDYAEGRTAFMQKRKPVFKGR